MVSKVKVHGKAQNRTVLGIINAYLVIYPQATLEDLKKAFPASLNATYSTPEKPLFITKEDKVWHEYLTAVGYFQEAKDCIKTADNKTVAVAGMWNKETFERMVEFAKQYGIEVASFEEREQGAKRGSFTLEYLNGFIPPKPKSKGIPTWVWIILGVLVVVLILAFTLK